MVQEAARMQTDSAEDGQILTAQTIDDNSPGTILRDFDTLLEVVGLEGIAVTRQHHRLPLNALAPLNARMTHPIELGLSRPQQRSYPHINALYLLLRASGLTEINGIEHTWRLVLDPVILDSWRDLNASERYLTLLETWLLRGRPEILEPDAGWHFPAPIEKWQHFAAKIPAQGRRIAGDPEEALLVKYDPGLLTIGMLDLFGLITVEPGVAVAGKAWCIDRVHRTPWGDALLHVLSPALLSMPPPMRLDSDIDVPFGALQEVLQPWFPAWRRNLKHPDVTFRDGTYIFKVSWGRVWRRIAIAAQDHVDRLAHMIIDAFGFSADHLYWFAYRNRFGVQVRLKHPLLNGPLMTREVLIGELPLRPGESMAYVYDLGRQWRFDVQLERLDPVDRTIGQAIMLEAHGEAPVQYPWVDDEEA